MTVASPIPSSILDAPAPAGSVRIGIDLVQVSAIERSVEDFGGRFTLRLFSAAELRDSMRDGRLDLCALAARFAAKEAAIKAFDLADAGIGWAQIEVVVADSAAVGRVRLHGRAAEMVGRTGAYDIAVSLSRDGDLACAIVVALPATRAAVPDGAKARGPSGGREGCTNYTDEHHNP